MDKYTIKQPNIDFIFLNDPRNMKGSRKKRLVYDIKNEEKAMFKYEEYNCTESCSEKISYEISKLLGYDCAKIELAKDEYGTLGILNYIFLDLRKEEHSDAVSYLNPNGKSIKEFYTIENIEKCLNDIDKNLFKDFLKIMVFDALVGETDRHEENWGILLKNGKYKISPLYDNGCNLLREFKNEKLLNDYSEGKKDFNAYINRSKSLIYNPKSGKKYTHFELIKKLKETHQVEIEREINKLNKITNEEIEEIVNKIPNELMTDIHKQFIVKYLIIRKQKLLKIIE